MTAAGDSDRRDWMVAARERTGRSQEALARYLGTTSKTVSTWERGLAIPKVDMRPDLAEALGLTMDELIRRLGLRSALDPAELNGNADPFTRITESLSLYERAEQSAYTIWTFELAALPSLCQTAGYARAVESSGHRDFTNDEIEHLVETRMARAAVLGQAAYVALIPTYLVTTNKGGPDVMADQMAHLLDLADRSNVTLHVIEPDHLTAAAAPFTLVAQAGDVPDLVVEPAHAGSRYVEGATAAADQVALFDYLRAAAHSPEESRDLIARSADRFAAMATMKGSTI